MNTGRVWVLMIAILVSVMSAPAHSSRINRSTVVIGPIPQINATFEQLLLTAPLFDNAPFQANKEQIVPGFSDPLGTGVDPELRVFAGKVHFMDVLGDFDTEPGPNGTDEGLPPGTFKGLDLTEDLVSVITSGRQRGFDSSILNLKKAELTERHGLPVTTETSPLSLAGFGSVSEFFFPINTHWVQCSRRDRRIYMMTMKPAKIRNRFPPNPATCYSL
jgi:hypothetical protein